MLFFVLRREEYGLLAGGLFRLFLSKKIDFQLDMRRLGWNYLMGFAGSLMRDFQCCWHRYRIIWNRQ